jgi:DNA-binding MarR family transcriptional regulator
MIDEPVSPEPAHYSTLSWGLFEDSLGPIVFLLSSALTSRSHAALAPYGLPPGSLSVLTLIHANPGCSQMDVARTTGMSKSGVVGLVDELERRELAARDRSVEDRRRYMLTLTAKGEEQLDAMIAAQLAEEKPIRDRLGADELHRLVASLRSAYFALTGSGAP